MFTFAKYIKYVYLSIIYMKNVLLKTGAIALTVTITGCNSDTISVEDMKHEQYVKNFVNTFGVPDPNHSYAMAKSAGLHVTTKKGGHVTVTAEVRGQEYLFADLYVEPGTHALPVTIPSSVTELKVETALGVHIVPTSATVDIDTAPAASHNGSYEIEDFSHESDMVFIETDKDGQYPYLAFRPSDFLERYFELNPEGQDNVDNYSTFKPTTRKYPVYDSNGEELPTIVPDNVSFETTFAASNSSKGVTYYIFPIYWQRDSKGRKDYKPLLHKVKPNVFSGLYYPWELPYQGTSDIPFPHLGYSTSITSMTEIDINKLDKQFNYDDGSFDKSFDPDEATMVISRGIKVHMMASTYINDKGQTAYYHPTFALAVESGFKEDGTEFESFTSSSPFLNGWAWGENYYDTPPQHYLSRPVSDQMYSSQQSASRPGQDKTFHRRSQAIHQ